MFYKEIKEEAWPRSAFLEHLEAQGLKGKGELQDVTGLPKKTLDTSLTLHIKLVENGPIHRISHPMDIEKVLGVDNLDEYINNVLF